MILVGVSGGIAAYKSCELVRLLVRAGHPVQVVITPGGERFVGATTFAALSRRPVLSEQSGDVFPHLQATRGSRLFCIAPASANTLALLAHGEAPNVLTPVGAGVHRPAAGGAGHERAYVVGGRHPGERARPARPWRRADRARARRDGRGRAGPGPDVGARRDRRPYRAAAGRAGQPGRTPGTGHRRRHPRAAGRRAVPRQPLQRPHGRGRGRRGRPPWRRRHPDPGRRHRHALGADAHAAGGDGRAAARGDPGRGRAGRRGGDGGGSVGLPPGPARARQAGQARRRLDDRSWSRPPTCSPSSAAAAVPDRR